MQTMSRPPARHSFRILAPTVLLALALTACSQGTKGRPSAKATDAAPSTSTSSSSGTTSLPTSGTLSKAEFVTQMNTICADTDKTRNAVPAPTAAADYVAINEYFTKTLALYQAYVAQAKILVAQTPDSAELNAKWIALEEADFAVAGPYIEQLIVASAAKDATKVSDLVTKLQDLPDHSDQIAAFMTSYGLSACATLESS